MAFGRDFIREQDEIIEKLRRDYYSKAERLNLVVRANAAREEQIDCLFQMHEAGRTYFRKVEQAMLDRDDLRGEDFDAWREDRLGSAMNVLTGLLEYHQHLRKYRELLKPNEPRLFEPSPAAYKNMQSVLAGARPTDAKILRERFAKAGLPTDGFDHPYVPKPAPEQAHSRAMTNERRIDGHASAPIGFFIMIVIVFAILALACIGAGIYAIYSRSMADTTFDFFGLHLKSGHVGVALVVVGIAFLFFITRTILKKL
jgi:hypothetical protein